MNFYQMQNGQFVDNTNLLVPDQNINNHNLTKENLIRCKKPANSNSNLIKTEKIKKIPQSSINDHTRWQTLEKDFNKNTSLSKFKNSTEINKKKHAQTS